MFFKHGNARDSGLSPEYSVWKAMKQRCRASNNPASKHYHGRGIVVCEEWAADFKTFLRDMGPRPSLRHSIDRIDNDGNYEPSNCRWATLTEQHRNTRRNRSVARGDGVVFRTITEAAESVGKAPCSVQAVCAGRKKICGGFTWEYALPSVLSRRKESTANGAHDANHCRKI